MNKQVLRILELPEHLHSTFPSYAKLPENTLTEKKNIPFPSLTLITCLTGPPVTPPPLHWETQPHPLIHNHSKIAHTSGEGGREYVSVQVSILIFILI